MICFDLVVYVSFSDIESLNSFGFDLLNGLVVFGKHRRLPLMSEVGKHDTPWILPCLD